MPRRRSPRSLCMLKGRQVWPWRLVALGGMRDGLRLTRNQEKRIVQLHDMQSLAASAYRYGADVAIDRAAIDAASIGQDIDPNAIKSALFAAAQTFPIQAADLMPDLQGAALGASLRKAEEDWIASGFTLTKVDLLG